MQMNLPQSVEFLKRRKDSYSFVILVYKAENDMFGSSSEGNRTPI